MAMRMRRVLYSVVASCALAGALYVPARGAGLNIETVTIADLNAAFAEGTLTSAQLVGAYLKRIEAYDKHGPAINAIITNRRSTRRGSSMRNARAAKCADRCTGSPSW
jgi:Asp-tRNA(Asn)/Glu-tRNA(Gln) amidotransferase A subunit family amidase